MLLAYMLLHAIMLLHYAIYAYFSFKILFTEEKKAFILFSFNKRRYNPSRLIKVNYEHSNIVKLIKLDYTWFNIISNKYSTNSN